MNNPSYGIYRAGLNEVSVEIQYNSDEARELIDFLLCDFPCSDGPVISRRFGVVVVGHPPKMSLWLGEKQYYYGDSKQLLAYFLINEIFYDCIVNNKNYQAVHAAAVASGSKGILLAGKSGSGKSSLAAWLTASGLTYLTDELVLFSQEGRMQPMTRPLCLKPPSYSALKKRMNIDEKGILQGRDGSMIPHRSLKPQWLTSTPTLDSVVFPTFIEGQAATLTKISGAVSCLKLMECYVNARNIPGHGFKEIAKITRNAAAYELKFGSFDGVLDVLSPLL